MGENMINQELIELKKELISNNYFDPDPLFFWRDLLINISMQIVAILILNESLLFASFLLGLYYLRIGWLSHDLQHGQFFKKHYHFFYWFTGWIQGLNYFWWMCKHNRHHLAPNAFTYKNNRIYIIDEDMDTAPLFTWDLKFFNFQNINFVNNFYISFQHVLFLPILLFLRILWIKNSFQFAIKTKQFLTAISLVVYYILFVLIATLISHSIYESVVFLLIGNMFGGFLIGITVVANHFGHPPHEFDENKKLEDIISSTSDIKDSFLVGFLMGGMQYHIAHHLYSKTPRSKLKEVTSKITNLCLKYDIELHTVSWVEALKASCKQLEMVSSEYKSERKK